MEKPKIIFIGTPEFAVPTLEKLHQTYGISLVVTVPDKAQGRGLKLMPSAVKQKAVELGIPISQPESLKSEEFIKILSDIKPDIIVVLAFRILPEEVYTLSKLGTFNIHASLLPAYRGAAPINWAIINGEKKTGLTSFLLEKKVDTGSILLTKEFEIPEGFTAGDLHDALMPLSADLAVETCELLLSGNYQLIPQDDSKASKAPKIFPEDCKIDWSLPANQVRNFIHGTSPIPGAWTIWDDKRLKIFRAKVTDYKEGIAGFFIIENSQFIVFCGEDAIIIEELQPEGRKPMKIKDFLNGYKGEKQGIFD
ncbi:MAG: methionyl-tRNA formyltransferase [Candidatus Kapabacteria bacterium]|nr:methionyl-tRNA formyltransferase [Candidatus Kapabacteria bacterium]